MKSKKGYKIIEAEKDFKSFREFLQYVGTFLIFLGFGLITLGLVLGVINLIKGL